MIESNTFHDLKAHPARKLIAFMMMFGIVFGGVACKSRAASSGVNVMQVYYLPIGMETLVGVTTKDLEARGQKCLIDNKGDINKIERILASAKPIASPGQGFEDKSARVEVLEKTQQGTHLIAVVENQGSIRRGDGSEGILSASDLATLKKLIEAHLK